jgi:hypothetical protein
MMVGRLTLSQAEFNTLDSALVAAILNDTNEIDEARLTLNTLQSQTAVDDFTAGHDSCPELGEGSSETDLTWRTDGDDEEPPSGGVESLGRIFPKLGTHALKRVLAGCQGNINRAVDELLNRSSLDADPEEGGKGIDAFDGELNCWGKKKGRRRKNRTTDLSLRRTSSLPNESAPANGTESRWTSMSRDVAYLSSCLGIETTKVRSVYHSHNGALALTILDLIESYGNLEESLDPSHLDELHQLSSEFSPAVSTKHLERLLQLCRENKQAVFEFAEILSQSPSKPTAIPARPTPPAVRVPPKKLITPNTAVDDSNWTVIGHSLRPSPISPRNPSASMTSREASSIADTYTSARNEAFQKARAAHRMSKSDRLMGGAAAFYANMGHDFGSKVKQFGDIAAESLVDENSGPNRLDLHGTTVKQAISISRERTTQWWVRNGGERNLEPFSIITGLGRHSRGGSSVLLPAVSNMLNREGWNIRAENGNILVYGVKAPASR